MESLLITYQIRTDAEEIEERAMGVAVEQSIEMPLQGVRDPAILDEIVGKVESIQEEAPGLFQVAIRFSAVITGMETTQLLNVLFGNTSMQPDISLVDAELPPSLLAAFPGPRFGLPGLRKLTGVYERPLTCTALKPMGSSPEELAALCRTFAMGGIDIIKDDHGLANQAFAPFAERVRACQAAVDQVYAETGHRAIYAPNLSGRPSALWEQTDIVRELGVGMVMASPMLIGLPTYDELVRERIDVPILGHPALGGCLHIAPELFFGKLYRLIGSDAVIYPNYGGRFGYSKKMCTDLAANLRDPWGDLAPAAPVPAGGMTVDRVDEMIDFYGMDTILLIGGGLLIARERLLEQSAAFVEQVQRSAG
jgi:ribulose-bisphosphate carboxylase large chain